jgi:nitrous oxide reductase accessory protein NosL
MRRTPLAAMLTLLAAVAATVVLAGCGGKSTGTSTSTPTKSSTTSTTHKQPSHAPAY